MANPVGRSWQLADRGDGRGDMLIPSIAWENEGPITFVDGTSGTYDLSNDVSGPVVYYDVDPATPLPATMSLDNATGVLTFTDTGGDDTSVDDITFRIHDAVPALEQMPSWNDENSYYLSEGIGIVGAARHVDEDGANGAGEIANFRQGYAVKEANQPDGGDWIHTQSEGEDLWNSLHMVKRLQGTGFTEAIAIWTERRDQLYGYFRDRWRSTTPYQDNNNQHDHMYGWGLLERYADLGSTDSAVETTIDGAVDDMIIELAGTDPGDPIDGGDSGRKWGRQLRFAVAAQKYIPNAKNLAHRDKVIDVMLQASNWNPTRFMYEMDAKATNAKVGAGGVRPYDGINDVATPDDAYAAGYRCCNTFHMGVVHDGLWHAWKELESEGDPRAATARQRLIDMGTFWRDLPADQVTANAGYWNLFSGYNVTLDVPCVYTKLDEASNPTKGVYHVAPVNAMVFAYKFTGDVSFLTRAKTVWQEYITSLGSKANIDRYIDTRIELNSFLGNNRGVLQYMFALIENGGNPSVLP